jgi:phage gpG-like protein
MLGFNIDIENKNIKDTLNELQGKLSDLTPVMRIISETMHNAVMENFETEGKRLSGGKWTGLSDATIKRREKSEVRIRDEDGKHVKYKRGDKKGQYRTRKVKPTWPGKILQESGLLMDSYRQIMMKLLPWLELIKFMPLLITSETPGRNIPERAFLVLTDEDMDKIEDDIRNFLEP